MIIPKISKQKKGVNYYAVCKITVDGKRKTVYLGKYGSPEADRKYRQLIAAYLDNTVGVNITPDLSISYLYNRYLDTIEGQRDSDANNDRRAIRYAVECFGDSVALGDFADDTKTMRMLTEYQQYLLSIAKEERIEPAGRVYGVQSRKAGQPVFRKSKRKWTYTGINRLVKKWVAVLRWGCRQGILPFAVFRVLNALQPLNARSGLPRAPEAEAVPDDVLLAVMPYMTPTLREMVALQRGTGMRAKEVCELLVGDIDRSGDAWQVKTGRHKTAAHLRYRYFAFSLEETAMLRRRCAGKTDDQHVFSQRESFAELWEINRANRKTPVYKQEREHEKKIAKSRLDRYHDYFSERSYAQSLRTACGRARRAGIDVKDIAPKSIRHAAYTAYSAKYGVELASKNAGHTSPRMADVYDHSLRMAAEQLAADRGLFGSAIMDLTTEQKAA